MSKNICTIDVVDDVPGLFVTTSRLDTTVTLCIFLVLNMPSSVSLMKTGSVTIAVPLELIG